MIVKGDKVSEPGYPRQRRGQVGTKSRNQGILVRDEDKWVKTRSGRKDIFFRY
jgi:hypothetical protein